jgi:hypothetical protein
MGSRGFLVLLALAGGAVAFVVVATGSTIAGLVAGGLVLATVLVLARDRVPHDPSRRRLLGVLGALGLAAVAAGTAAGAAVRMALRPDPAPAIDAMARTIGADALELIRLTTDPAARATSADPHAGFELELPAGVHEPPAERPTHLHALPWMYLGGSRWWSTRRDS